MSETELDLDELERLLAAAPTWTREQTWPGVDIGHNFIRYGTGGHDFIQPGERNADLMMALRKAAPELVRLARERDTAEAFLKDANDLTMKVQDDRDAQEARAEAAERELAFYKEREKTYATKLGVSDGGQYRADWAESIDRLIRERDAWVKRYAEQNRHLDMGIVERLEKAERERNVLRAQLIAVHSNTDCTGAWPTCPVNECEMCAVRDCPSGEPLHYHHDGCPNCDGGET